MKSINRGGKMRRTIPIKMDPTKAQSLVFLQNLKTNRKQFAVWNLLHNKTLKTSGRGGKGHFVGGGIHNWNRKGRW